MHIFSSMGEALQNFLLHILAVDMIFARLIQATIFLQVYGYNTHSLPKRYYPEAWIPTLGSFQSSHTLFYDSSWYLGLNVVLEIPHLQLELNHHLSSGIWLLLDFSMFLCLLGERAEITVRATFIYWYVISI